MSTGEGAEALECLALVDAWVQGQRRPSIEGRDTPNDGWRPVLFARLTSRFKDIEQGVKTRESEEGLHLGRNSYFYVGRCEPDTGNEAIVFRGTPFCDGAVCPFDTGGIWHGHLLVSMEKSSFVDEYTYSMDAYSSEMNAWIEASFDRAGDYCRGFQPSSLVPSEFLEPTCDPRHWTWEVRVCPECLEVEPVAVVLSTVHFDQFTKWLRSYAEIPPRLRSEVTRRVRRLRLDPAGESEAGVLNAILGQVADRHQGRSSVKS